MDLFGYYLSSLAGAAAAFTAVYGAFAKFDGDQSEENRRFVRDWLLGLKVDDQKWAHFFTTLFTRFFGVEHWSVQCAKRSFALSLTLIAVIWLLWYREINGEILVYIVTSVMLGCVMDYFSLWKTRFILTRLSSFGSGRIIAIAVASDFLATSILFVATVFLLLLTKLGTVFGDAFKWMVFWNTIDALVSMTWASLNYKTTTILPIWLLYSAALLTSAWLWVYLIVAYGMRTLSKISPLFKALTKILDFNDHPVRSIGYVAAAVSAIIVGVATLI
jgi:hypothetical protein